MKSFRLVFRSFRDAFKSVVRNFSLSLASITCITITLIIIAASFLISENVRNFTDLIEKDVTVVVFLSNDTTEEDRKLFEEELQKMDNIDYYDFSSKQEVKTNMAKEYDNLKTILDDWEESENPLKDTYTIKVVDVEKIKDTADKIKTFDKVDSVQYGEGLVEKMLGAFSAVEKITLIAALALVVVTIFLIINTIKLTIFSRKQEIYIMRLVGASNMRIKLPFVIEGVVLGIIGSIIPTVIIIFGYTALYNKMGGVLFSSLIKLVKPIPFIFNLSVVVIAIGILVGMIGSARAVRRYVKI
ncbi:MAG: permease-like cell division protein FtsX [bacterium]|nr:permease-like cell division protein FtsX [bacterium]